MKLLILASVTLALAYAESANVTEAQNKTKRGLSEQIIYGDPSGIKPPPPSFQDQQSTATTPSLAALYANTQRPYLYQSSQNQQSQSQPLNEVPKQVSAQTLLYEYQQQSSSNPVASFPLSAQYSTLNTHNVQSPNEVNKASNADTAQTQVVYANYQLPYSTIPSHQASIYPLFPVKAAESIAVPVQHKTYVNHGIPLPLHQQQQQQIQAHPNQHNQALAHLNQNLNQNLHQNIPSHSLTNSPMANHHHHNQALQSHPVQAQKFVQANLNKYNYFPITPTQNNYQQQNLHPLTYHPIKTPYTPYNPYRLQPIKTPILPTTYNVPHYQKPIPKTTPAPIKPPKVREEQEEEEEEEKANVKSSKDNEEEEDTDSYEKEEEDDDEEYTPYEDVSRYEEDDDEDHRHHSSYKVEEDDDEDSERDSSRHVPKSKPKKHHHHHHSYNSKPQKYRTGENYKYHENYKTKSAYKKPYDSDDRKGKTHYKSYKYSKKNNGKPKIETIEGKHSQHVPVVHNQKFFKEKWFVSNSHEESQ